MIIPVLLSGGSGTRLWPLSRSVHPKQLLPLTAQQTMLQQTALRLSGLDEVAAPIVVCNEEHRFMVAEQLRQIDQQPSAILLEPVGRNTAPAVALAALQALKVDTKATLLILPADHSIAHPEALCDAIKALSDHVEQGMLATFGIVPTCPETGYGYIQKGTSIQTSPQPVFTINSFVEKPDLPTAQDYVGCGDYYWNSGMFMFQAARYLEELERFEPGIVACCKKALHTAQNDLDFVRIGADAFGECTNISIDYAVMERVSNAIVVPLDAGWNDVGSWSSLWDIGNKDQQNNVIRGDVLTHDVSNSYLHGTSRLLSAVGVDNLIVVETSDAILVAHRDRAQEIKEIVRQLATQGRPEADTPPKVARPWGWYESIDHAERFQVKHITVKPGASLSLQMHHHRAEHWVIVKGTARITRDDEVLTLTENQSTYIPLGTRHRLENPGKIPLELIEIQSGSYLGEDDIVRFEDNYGR
ncbi:mannose-1-phosphate guanylyltransferase/mannose-6-phosphate isomerase [uncultured Desulfuromonas sp.]|uniref:mannose-1-phosphate guanylyltransferase/mannose-6-phosphate isomerase n=1 Tax=uncultured Desulfuromonas sp. TaxID=181013 RepID=UPI002AAC2356|nr:mannose-1-phosphate guanylyltransferase/mannose-6-phosphate isomerase [uncultured Desulfuromonas sp.]